jgi:hypothetical protein
VIREEDSVASWGTGSFENDDAAVWLAQVSTVAPADLTQILLRAADHPGYLEAYEASVAVAAAEVVAALSGSPAPAVPSTIVEWTKKNPEVGTAELRALAVRALERVRRNSEVKDLWLEADGLNDWTAAIQELQTRLSDR